MRSLRRANDKISREGKKGRRGDGEANAGFIRWSGRSVKGVEPRKEEDQNKKRRPKDKKREDVFDTEEREGRKPTEGEEGMVEDILNS